MIQLEEKAAEALACVQKAEKLMAELGYTKYSLSGMISAAMRHDLEKEVSKLLGELAEARRDRDALIEGLEKIASLDFVITLPDRMDAVRNIANETLNKLKP